MDIGAACVDVSQDHVFIQSREARDCRKCSVVRSLPAAVTFLAVLQCTPSMDVAKGKFSGLVMVSKGYV